MFPFDRPLIRTLPPPAEVPLAQGDLRRALVAAFVFNEPTPGLRDRVSGIKAVGFYPGVTGTARRYLEPDIAYGQGLYLDGSYVTWQPGASYSPFQLSGAFSVAWGGAFQTRDTLAAFHWGLFNAARTLDISFYSYGGVLYLRVDGVNYSLGLNSDTEYDGGAPRRRADSCVAWSAASGSVDTFIRGQLKASTAITTPPGDHGADPYLVLGSSGPSLATGESADGVYAYLYVFNKKLTPAEARQIADSIWCPFPSQPGLIWVPPSAGGAATHSATGVLTADAATVAGTAARLALHASSGALVAGAATVTGTAARIVLHASTGTLVAGAAVVDGVAARFVTHESTGAVAAGSAVVVGTAARLALHTATGVLAADGATTAGTSARASPSHAASGTLTADAATAAGTAAHLTLHAASGALVAGSATAAGESARGSPNHASTGTLTADAATVVGTAARVGIHAASGALAVGSATVAGDATRASAAHPSSGALIAGAATVSGTASRYVVRTSAGILSAGFAVVSGAAARQALRVATGALAAQAATVAGVAARIGGHVAAGNLSAQAAAVVGVATKFAVHSSSGALVAGSAAVAGSSRIGEEVIYAAIPSDNVPLVRGGRPAQLSSARRRN